MANFYLSDSPIWNFSPIKSHPDTDLIKNNKHKQEIFNALTFWGSAGSAFALHDEPDKVCSINYLHPIDGTHAKFWICFTILDSFKLKAYLKKRFDHLFEYCENYLRHSSLLFHPKILQELDITYYHGLQMPGDIIVTFSGGLHMGYNMGVNLAEVSFGIKHPLTFGTISIKKHSVLAIHQISVSKITNYSKM